MHALYDPSAPKKATNLSINQDLLLQARELKINLSATLEQALRDQLGRKKADIWREQNNEAIEAYNQSVNENGVFSDGLRSF